MTILDGALVYLAWMLLFAAVFGVARFPLVGVIVLAGAWPIVLVVMIVGLAYEALEVMLHRRRPPD